MHIGRMQGKELVSGHARGRAAGVHETWWVATGEEGRWRLRMMAHVAGGRAGRKPDSYCDIGGYGEAVG